MALSKVAASRYAGTGAASPDTLLPGWVGAAALASQSPIETWVMRQNKMVAPCHKMVDPCVSRGRAFQI